MKLLHQGLGHRFLHPEFELRKPLCQYRGKRGEQIGRDRGNKPKLQGTAQNAVLLPRLFLYQAHFIENAAEARQKLFARFRQHHGTAIALDENAAEPPLQLGDLGRQRGLRDMDILGCLAEVEPARQGIEIGHLLERYHDSKKLSKKYKNTIGNYRRDPSFLCVREVAREGGIQLRRAEPTSTSLSWNC